MRVSVVCWIGTSMLSVTDMIYDNIAYLQDTIFILTLSAVHSRYLEGSLRNTSIYLYLDISDLQNWGKNKSNNHISQINT